MRKGTGVQRKRKNSDNWPFGIKAPTELRHLYPTQWAHRQSLGTPDLKTALQKAAVLRAEWLGKFAAQRLALAGKVTDADGPATLARVNATLDNLIRERLVAFDFKAATMTLGQREEVEETLDALHDHAQPAAEGHTEPEQEAHTLLAEALRAAGLHAEAMTPKTHRACLGAAQTARVRLLVLQSEALETPGGPHTKRREWLGDLAPQPVPAVPVPGVMDAGGTSEPRQALAGGLDITTIRQLQGLDIDAGKQKLSELFAAYYESHRDAWKNWEDRTRRDYGPVEKATLAVLGDVRAEALNLSHIGRMAAHFRAEADRKGLSSGTLGKTHSRLAAVLRWAASKRILADLTPPLKDLTVTYESYEAFTDEDLKALFVAGYPAAGFARASKFWLPVLGLFTGARVEELAAIKMEHVGPDPDGSGAYGILLSPEGRVTGKNEASRRFFPLPPALASTGFLRYLDTIKAERHTDLFPCIGGGKRDGKGKTGTRDFIEHRRAVGVGTAEGDGRGKKSFHSFRSTLITALRRAQVDGEVRRAIVGHGPEDVHDRVYNQIEVPAPLKLEALTKVQFAVTLPVWQDSPKQQAARQRQTKPRKPRAVSRPRRAASAKP